MPTTEMIFPEYIRQDGDTQPRAKVDQRVCDEYGQRMKAGEKFPAIDVFFDGENYWLADGFHRVQASFMALPGEAVECNLYQGSLQDAQWHSYSVNRAHGLRRTNEDKERAVKLALAHPAAVDKSNVAIAAHCGVDEKTVRKYRDKATASSEIPRMHRRTVTRGRSTYRQDNSKIGKYKGAEAVRRTMERYDTGSSCRPACMVALELANNNATDTAYGLLRHFAFQYLQSVFEEIVRINHRRP